MVFTRNKAHQIYRKTNISYPLIRTLICFVFHRFENRSFVLLPMSLQYCMCFWDGHDQLKLERRMRFFSRNSAILTLDLSMPLDDVVRNFTAKICASCFIGTASLLTPLFPVHPVSTPWNIRTKLYQLKFHFPLKTIWN